VYSAKYILDSDLESDQDSDPYLPSSPSPSPQQTNHLFPNIGHVDFDVLGVEQGIECSKKSGHSLRSDESSPEAEIASLALVTSPLSLRRDLFIIPDLEEFFSSTNTELCLSPTKFDGFPQSGFL